MDHITANNDPAVKVRVLHAVVLERFPQLGQADGVNDDQLRNKFGLATGCLHGKPKNSLVKPVEEVQTAECKKR